MARMSLHPAVRSTSEDCMHGRREISAADNGQFDRWDHPSCWWLMRMEWRALQSPCRSQTSSWTLASRLYDTNLDDCAAKLYLFPKFMNNIILSATAWIWDSLQRKEFSLTLWPSIKSGNRILKANALGFSCSYSSSYSIEFHLLFSLHFRMLLRSTFAKKLVSDFYTLDSTYKQECSGKEGIYDVHVYSKDRRRAASGISYSRVYV
jgi:hypothetical protein